MAKTTCETNNKGIGIHLLTSLLLMAVGVVGLLNGLDMLDVTWLLLGLAYLVGGKQSETASVRWYFRSVRGVIALVLMVGAIVTMGIEIFTS